MRRRQRNVDSPSDTDSDTDPDGTSCFDTENEDSDLESVLPDINADFEPDIIDASWQVKQDNIYPPEHYIKQEREFNEAEFDIEDYQPNTVVLFDVIKGGWNRSVKCLIMYGRTVNQVIDIANTPEKILLNL